MRIWVAGILVFLVTTVSAQDWLDTDGHVIDAHGAVLYHDSVYYLFGEIKKGPTRLVAHQDWEDYRVAAGGVSCYSSRDLVHWAYRGTALAAAVGDTAGDLDTGRVIERPKVIYNGHTRKYVLWMHIDRNDYAYARAGVAVSDRPEGPYRYIGSYRPNGEMSRDMTVYKDDDGRAYLVYASENNNTMQVCLLSEDYLSPTPVFKRILVGQRREAPAVFKEGGKYYLITSLCSGWDPNAAAYAVADSMMGNWEQQGNPCVGKDANTTFHAQSSFVLPIEHEKGSFLFMADRWNKTDLENSGYCWLPLRVENGKVVIRDFVAVNDGFESGLSGRTVIGEPGSVGIDSAHAYAGAYCARIGSGRGSLLKRLDASPLSIVSYSIYVLSSAKTVPCHSFIRFYDSAHVLLLAYKSGPLSPVSYQSTGDYTETPPYTRSLEIGVEKDAAEGFVYADSLHVDQDIGTPPVPHTPACDIGRYLRPFWKTDTIFNETVLLLASKGRAAQGRLLFAPSRILSVQSFDLGTIYKAGADYSVNGNTITRKAGSHMPFRTDTSFDSRNDLAWYNLQSQWVVVSYTHKDKWNGPAPSYKGDRLPHLMAKLKATLPVRIVAYGMSITRGLDVSGYDDVPPYMPDYMDLWAAGLRKRYGYAGITLYNAGLPGSLVSWGAEYAGQYLNPLKPDLVVIDFGMNDFWRYTPGQFKAYVDTIIRKVRSVNPEAEFLLISNMKFDPGYILDTDKYKSFYTGNMQGYQRVLLQMEARGIVNLDLNTISGILYQHKKPKDCITNPLHPNDYLARWYAQGLLALLIPDF